jgi:hypothetical protein
LKDDNGGIVLDISEQGLAMQAVKSLGDDAYTQLRFQLSQSNDWVETLGRIAWISDSKQTAGVEFINLSYESLIFIRNWTSSILSPDATEENAIPDTVAWPKHVLTFDEAANVTPIPESAEIDIVVEELVQELITEDLAAMWHRVDFRDAGGAPGNANRKTECQTPDKNISPTNGLELTLYPRAVTSVGLLTSYELPSVNSVPRRYIGLLVGIALLLSVLLSLSYSLRKTATARPHEKATSPQKLSEAPSNSATSSMIAPHKPRASSDAGFILQVAAMKNEKSAMSVADLLRQNGLPAYVFKPATENVYRVLVGPYSDADSAMKVEENLRKRGFEAIRKQNTPAQ